MAIDNIHFNNKTYPGLSEVFVPVLFGGQTICGLEKVKFTYFTISDCDIIPIIEGLECLKDHI